MPTDFYRHAWVLMEFLSALYICKSETPLELLKERFKDELAEDILHACRLMAGFSTSKIINLLLSNFMVSNEGHGVHFLLQMLHAVSEFNSAKDRQFSYSIQILLCLLNTNLTRKEDLHSVITKFECRNFASNVTDTNTLMYICRKLLEEYRYSEDEVMKDFECVSFESFNVNNTNNFHYISLFKLSGGVKLYDMQLNSSAVQELREEVLGHCKWVEIADCKFKDESYDQCTSMAALKKLAISKCILNINAFTLLCGWGLSSEAFHLWDNTMENECWNELVSGMEEMKNKDELQLKVLDVKQQSNQIATDAQRRVRGNASYLFALLVSIHWL